MFEKFLSKIGSTFNIQFGTFSLLNPHSRKEFTKEDALSISTVYTCVKVLSDTIARLPINVYLEDKENGKIYDRKDNLYFLLNHQPNSYTSSHTFFSILETHRNLHGNSFAKIYRNPINAQIEGFEILSPLNVLGYELVNNNIYYKIVNKDGVSEVINSKDILHFKGITTDGIWGINPIEALKLNLSTNWQGLKTIDNFYKNNLNTPRVIQSTLNTGNNGKMQEQINDLKTKYAGAQGSGELIALPPNTEIKDLQLNFADAEIIATLKYNKTDVAALYGIPGSYIGIYEATKYNSVEAMVNEFKATTLSAITNIYVNELEFKLLSKDEILGGKGIEFNLNALNETDFTTRINGYKSLASIGVMTPNQIAKLEGYDTFEGGDDHYLMSNMMSLEKYNKGLVSPGTTNTQIQSDITDPSIN